MPSKIIADTFLAQVCGANLRIVCAFVRLTPDKSTGIRQFQNLKISSTVEFIGTLFRIFTSEEGDSKGGVPFGRHFSFFRVVGSFFSFYRKKRKKVPYI